MKNSRSVPFSKVSASAYERVSAEWECANTEFDCVEKTGIEKSVRNQSSPLTRVSVSAGELTVVSHQRFSRVRVLRSPVISATIFHC